MNCDRYADTLMRLPLFYEETQEEAAQVDKLVLEGAKRALGA